MTNVDLSRCWDIKVAAYKKDDKMKTSVWFYFPSWYAAVLGKHINIQRIDDETWEIKPGGNLHWHEENDNWCRVAFLDTNITPFDPVDAIAIPNDKGWVQVHCPIDTRQGLVPVPPSAPVETTHGEREFEYMEACGRRLLREIHLFEQTSTYRFIRVSTGEMELRSPTIRMN